MKLRCLFERIERLPLLRIVVPFAAGIALADRFSLPLWFTVGAFVAAGSLALLLRSQRYAAALLLAAGWIVADLHRSGPTVPCDLPTLFEIEATGIPTDRGRYTTVEGSVRGWYDPEAALWRPASDRVVLRADSSSMLAGGERLYCRGRIRPLRGPEGYLRTMSRRGFVGSLWLSPQAVLRREPASGGSFHRAAAGRIAALGVAGDAGAVVRAMTAGDISGLTSDLRMLFSRSGMAHLLAVSGLHTGIVFLLANLALWWLPLVRRGHRVRALLVAAAVWIFAAAAGFPPSAVRAAVMCTVLQAALASGAEYSGLNALGAAAFGMLLWNPAWLGEIGFRLSFVAVAAILAWGIPLCRRLRTRRRWLDAVVGAYAVGAVAALSTAPLVSNAFGVVPLAGILVGPVVVLLATVAVFAGVLWLLFPFGWLAPLLCPIAGGAAGGIVALARVVAALPGAAPAWRLSDGATAAVYLLFVAGTAVAWCRNPKKNVHLPA